MNHRAEVRKFTANIKAKLAAKGHDMGPWVSNRNGSLSSCKNCGGRCEIAMTQRLVNEMPYHEKCPKEVTAI